MGRYQPLALLPKRLTDRRIAADPTHTLRLTMQISPTTLSVNQLFSGNSEQFYIPAYQRRYSWRDQQTSELFDDLLYLESNETHLLGTVVCLTEDHVAGINRLELVDGQQRVTTLSLLLFAFRARFNQLGLLDDASAVDRLLKARGQDNSTGPKLLLGDLDMPDFDALLAGAPKEDVKNARLWDAFSLLSRRLSEVPDHDVLALFSRVCGNARVIRLDIGRAKDAYKLFETINNRGLALSETDIFKNFLLGHASLLSDDVLASVRRSWQKVIVALDGTNPDRFFRQLTASRVQRKVTDSQVIPEFKRSYLLTVRGAEQLADSKRMGLVKATPVESNDRNRITIEEFAQGLAQAAGVYGKIHSAGFPSARVNELLADLNRIRAIPAYVFLLDLFQRDVEEGVVLRILWMLQVFMLRRHICEYRTGELGDIFPRLAQLPDVGLADAVASELERFMPPDDEFRVKLPSHDFSGQARGRVRYMLVQLEQLEHGGTRELLVAGGQDVHVEHIIPQKIKTKRSKKRFGDWETYLGPVDAMRHRDEVNTLGNLTLLSGALNIVASNNPYQAKVPEYRKSAIKLTLRIPTEYEEFRFDQARARGEALAEKAVAYWRVPAT